MEGKEVSADSLNKEKFDSSVFGGRNKAHVERNNKTAFYGIVLFGSVVVISIIYSAIKHFFFT